MVCVFKRTLLNILKFLMNLILRSSVRLINYRGKKRMNSHLYFWSHFVFILWKEVKASWTDAFNSKQRYSFGGFCFGATIRGGKDELSTQNSWWSSGNPLLYPVWNPDWSCAIYDPVLYISCPEKVILMGQTQDKRFSKYIF